MIRTRPVSLFAIVAATIASVGGLQAQNEKANTVNGPRHVLIIRHSEKTGEKNDIHLSKVGFERADVLFRLFESENGRPEPFPVPDFIFAAANSAGSQRPLETVTPLSKKLNLKIDQNFQSTKSSAKADAEPSADTKGNLALRHELLGNPKYVGKTILVSWRHGSLPDLAKVLGAKDAPATWAGDCYDRVWQLTYDGRGGAAFADRPQRLLPGDSVK